MLIKKDFLYFLNELDKRKINMKSDELKKSKTFGWGLTGFFVIIGLIKLILSGHPGIPWQFYAAFAAGVINLAFPIALWPVYKAALFVAHYLGWFNTRLLLGIIFFFIITPLGFIFRLMGRDLLDRKFDKNTQSYWQLREKKEFDPSSVENQF
jgi:hypothetical protein